MSYLDCDREELEHLAKHEPVNDRQQLVCNLAKNHIDALDRIESDAAKFAAVSDLIDNYDIGADDCLVNMIRGALK